MQAMAPDGLVHPGQAGKGTVGRMCGHVLKARNQCVCPTQAQETHKSCCDQRICMLSANAPAAFMFAWFDIENILCLTIS